MALVAGLLGGAVMVVAAGARRTASSFERFADDVHAADLMTRIDGLEPEVVAQIMNLPEVEGGGPFTLAFAALEADEGNDLGLFLPHTREAGTEVERDRLLRGRRPGVDRIDEVTATETAATALGLDVGDEVEIGTLTSEQVAAEEYFPARGPLLGMTVVGITRGIDDLAGVADGGFVASPALLPAIRGEFDEFATFAALDLADGADSEAVAAAFAELVPTGYDLGTIALDVRAEPIRDAIDATASALAAFALLAGATWVVAIVQMVGREVGAGADERRIGATIGLDRRQRIAMVVATFVPVGALAAALAGIVAAAMSPIMPIALARRAEPDPGVSIDATVVGVGMLAIVAVVVIASALASSWADRRALVGRGPQAASATAMAAARIGAGPVIVSGVRLALDRRPPALPVRSALLGIVTAVVGIVGVATFAASLDRTVDSPSRWGIPWDLRLELTADTVAEGAEQAQGDDRLGAVARWDAGFTAVGDDPVRAFGLDVLRGDIGYALRSGSQPAAPDEVVIGSVTARRLDVQIGDAIDLGGVEVGTEQRRVRVVGIALFPQLDEGGLTDAVGLRSETFAEVAIAPDPFEASQVVARLADGSELDAVVADYADDMEGSVLRSGELLAPGTVSNLGVVRPTLGWMAGFVGLLGIVSLVHVIATTGRRRRGELATLRSLGLTRRQVAGCMVSQAAVLAVVGAVVGVPLGLLGGRAAWAGVAGAAELATDPERPVALIGALVAVTVLVAVVVALPPAIRATRRRPSVALHPT